MSNGDDTIQKPPVSSGNLLAGRAADGRQVDGEAAPSLAGFRRWSKEEDDRLCRMYQAGDKAFTYSIEEIAQKLSEEFSSNRSPAGCRARLSRIYASRRKAERSETERSGPANGPG